MYRPALKPEADPVFSLMWEVHGSSDRGEGETGCQETLFPVCPRNCMKLIRSGAVQVAEIPVANEDSPIKNEKQIIYQSNMIRSLLVVLENY